jgi:putative addiction module component (TIGR02574 family)
MPLTLEQIIEETRNWPDEELVQLVDRLEERLHAVAPEVEAAWRAEVHRRLEELQSGRVQALPGDEVSARVARVVGR